MEQHASDAEQARHVGLATLRMVTLLEAYVCRQVDRRAMQAYRRERDSRIIGGTFRFH